MQDKSFVNVESRLASIMKGMINPFLFGIGLHNNGPYEPGAEQINLQEKIYYVPANGWIQINMDILARIKYKWVIPLLTIEKHYYETGEF